MLQQDNHSVVSSLAVHILLVSNDSQTIKTLSQVTEQLAIHVEFATTSEAAIHELCRSKYEALVVDFQNQEDSVGLLRKKRAMTSNRSAVVWAIVNSNQEVPEAFRAGAMFVVVRPLSPSNLRRTLKVSYPLMVREKRRYHRTRVEAQVFVSSSSHSEFIASSINISEGGMALDGAVPLQVGEELTLRFKLPGTDAVMKLTAEVCWYDQDGRVGLQFITVSEQAKQQVQDWIAERFDESLADGVGAD